MRVLPLLLLLSTSALAQGYPVERPDTFVRVLVSAETVLDFNNLSSHGEHTLTIAVSGAGDGDLPICRATTEPTADIDVHEWVSAPGVVSLKAHNDSNGNVNPDPTTYSCIVFDIR